MNCAIGLTTAGGTQYRLDSDDPTLTATIPTSIQARVTGALSATNTTRYVTSGATPVETIEQL